MAGTNDMHPIADRWGRIRNFDFCSETEPTQTWPYMIWINPASQEIKVRNKANTGWIAIGGNGGGADEKVKVSANDASAGYLLPKLDAGTGIQLTELNDGGSEQVRIASNASLDDAYNAGRIITADAGAVEILGPGGLFSQGNIVLDAGAGDSPQIQLVGGSNDDTAWIGLDDDAVAGRSDLIIRLAGHVDAATLLIQDDVGNPVVTIRSTGFLTVLEAQVTMDINCGGDIFVGGVVDLQGGADALVLDGDGDTTISASTDDQIDFKTGGGDRMTLTDSGLAMAAGGRVNEFSTDGTLGGNSDLAVPTEKAAKTYIDARFPSGAIILWNNSDVCPAGFTRVAGADNRVLYAVAAGAGGVTGTASHSHTLGTDGNITNKDPAAAVVTGFSGATTRLMTPLAGTQTVARRIYSTDSKAHLYSAYKVLV